CDCSLMSALSRGGAMTDRCRLQRKVRRREQGFTRSPGVNGLVVLTPPSKLKQADALGGRNVSGAPPGESAPSALSTGTCLLLPSVRASPPPLRRRTDAAWYHPAGSVRASGNCARNRVSQSKRSRG